MSHYVSDGHEPITYADGSKRCADGSRCRNPVCIADGCVVCGEEQPDMMPRAVESTVADAAPPRWPTLEWWRHEAQALERETVTLRADLDKARVEIESLRALVCELSQRAPVAERSCTCPPEEAPKPCQRKYALSECVAAAKNVAPFPARALRTYTGPQVWR